MLNRAANEVSKAHILDPHWSTSRSRWDYDFDDQERSRNVLL